MKYNLNQSLRERRYCAANTPFLNKYRQRLSNRNNKGK